MHYEGELVERERGAGAEDEGEEREPAARRAEGEGDDAGDEHRHDAEDGVMQVDARRPDAAAEPPALLRPHDARVEADEGERAEEADEQEDERALALGEDRGGDERRRWASHP